MARTIETHAIGREPRRGELNYELKRLLKKHCSNKPFKQAIKSVELAVARLAKQFGFDEYECKYDRGSSLGRGAVKHRPWVTDSIEIIIFRRRPNRTLSIYRAGATGYPHFFPGPDGRYANLSAPRDVSIYYGVDEPYAWETYALKSKIPAHIKAKLKK